MCRILRAARSHCRFLLGLLLAACLVPAEAGAQGYLIDTGSAGTNSIGSYGLIAAGATNCSPQPSCGQAFNYLAARVVLPQASTVTGIDLWVVPFSSGGSMTIKIREEANGLPASNLPPLFSANSIYAKTYTDLPNVFGSPTWVNFGGFEAVLAAGTYWITFEPVTASTVMKLRKRSNVFSLMVSSPGVERSFDTICRPVAQLARSTFSNTGRLVAISNSERISSS